MMKPSSKPPQGTVKPKPLTSHSLTRLPKAKENDQKEEEESQEMD